MPMLAAIFMSYKLHSLSHASLVENADKIMKPILKYCSVTEIETNSIDAVIYTVYANGKLDNIEKICQLCKPIGELKRKIEIAVHFDKGLLLKFFGANDGKDIWLQVLKNNETKFECFLS